MSSIEKRMHDDLLGENSREKEAKLARVGDEAQKPKLSKYNQWTIDNIKKLFPVCTHDPPYTRDELLKLRASLKDLPEDEKLDLLDVYSLKAGRERLKYLNEIVNALFENTKSSDVLKDYKTIGSLYDQILAIQDPVDKVKYLEEEVGWKLKADLVDCKDYLKRSC